MSLLGKLPRECADHIVRLVHLLHLDRDVQGGNELVHALELGPEILRHRRAGSLVFRVELVTERLACLQRDDCVVGVACTEDVQEHRGEAVDGVRLLTLGRGHRRRQRVVGAKNKAEPVYKDDRALAIRCVGSWHAVPAPSGCVRRRRSVLEYR